jgi:ketosteroid isomerase-like protein
MAGGNVGDEDISELVERAAEAASALIRGDARAYFTLLPHADDYTLMAPWGGEPRRGFDVSDETLEALATYFQGGEAQVEVVQSYVSAELVVLVVMERQHGKVGGLPEQDMSLRVTLVFRRDDGEWRLVHRHADPLVHPISEEQLGALLRGDHQPSSP